MFFITLYTFLIQQIAFSMHKPTGAALFVRTDSGTAENKLPAAAAPLVRTGSDTDFKRVLVEAPLVRTGSGGQVIPNLTPLQAIDYASWNMHGSHSSKHDLTGKRPGPESLKEILQGLGSEKEILRLINTNFFDIEYIDEKTCPWLVQTALHRISHGVVLPLVFPSDYREKPGEHEFYEKLNERQFACAQVLLDLGASLLILDSRNCTPMHIVASTDRPDFVRLYAKYEPKCVDARGGKKNSTPLMTAVALHKNAQANMGNIDNKKSIQTLLLCGTKTNLLNRDELTALDLALDPAHPERTELISLLRAHGAKTAAEIQEEEEHLKELLNMIRNLRGR